MIFGCDNSSSACGSTRCCDERYDMYVNNLYAGFVIISFIVSGILNPALLWFHYSLPTTIPSILFRILNVSDFLTTSCLCPYLIWGLLSPALVPHQVPATDLQRLYSAVFAYILFMSVSITTIMTATRVFAIKYPFKRMKKKFAIAYPMIALMLLALIIVVINFYYNSTWDRYLYSTNRLKLVLFKEGTGQISNWPELAFGGILMSIAVMGCVCAIITGLDIRKSEKQMRLQRHNHDGARRKENRGCVTILMLSGGIQVAVLLVIAQFIYSIYAGITGGFSYHSNYFFYANGLFCSLVLSVVNPIITVVRCTGFKQFFTRKFRARTTVTANNHTICNNLNNINSYNQQSLMPIETTAMVICKRNISSNFKVRPISSVSS